MIGTILIGLKVVFRAYVELSENLKSLWQKCMP